MVNEVEISKRQGTSYIVDKIDYSIIDCTIDLETFLQHLKKEQLEVHKIDEHNNKFPTWSIS